MSALRTAMWCGLRAAPRAAIPALALIGCATVPPTPRPVLRPAPISVISIIELSACNKTAVYVVITSDGAVNAAATADLSKAQIAGIKNTEGALPDENVVEIEVPCIPSQQT